MPPSCQACNHQELQELAEELTGLWLGIKGNRCIYRGGLFGSLWRFASRARYTTPRSPGFDHCRIDSERLFHPRTVVKVTVVSFETENSCAPTAAVGSSNRIISLMFWPAPVCPFLPAVPIAGQHWYDGVYGI